MINFTFKGHKISIRNDDWRKLKERFNVERAEKDMSGYRIRKLCSICKRYYLRDASDSCENCPFHEIPHSLCEPCMVILNSLFVVNKFESTINYIRWIKCDNRQARRQLKAILRRMEKVEASQGKEK